MISSVNVTKSGKLHKKWSFPFMISSVNVTKSGKLHKKWSFPFMISSVNVTKSGKLHKKWSFPFMISSVNVTKSGKLHFLCSSEWIFFEKHFLQTKACLEPSRTYTMDLFCEQIVNGFYQLTIFGKKLHRICCLRSKYISAESCFHWIIKVNKKHLRTFLKPSRKKLLFYL